MANIPENYENDKQIKNSINNFLKFNKVSHHLEKANAYKKKGVPVIEVFAYLLQLVYTKKSMYMNILNGTHNNEFARDVVYRLLNATYINWANFLLHLATGVVNVITKLTSEKRLNAIIIDDTMYERLRSKKVELLANVYDHAAKTKNKYKRGFRMLTLAWTDGATLIPLLYRHMSSAEKKNRYNEANEKLDKRVVGYKIRQQAVQSATTVMLTMLEQIKKARIPARHVVFDSWFSFPVTMMNICKIGFDVVGRLKDTPKIKYLVNNAEKTLKEIYVENKKRCGRAKYLLSVEVMLYNDKKETRQARIIFVRDRNNRNKWIAFGCTDMALTEEEIIELYGKRWDIEVFFKICKSYLNLGREFQGISYDSITAHTAIVMTRYIMLSIQKRQNEDPRSLGELFFLMYDEISDIKFSDVISQLLVLLHTVLEDCLFLSLEQIDEIIDSFIAKLFSFFKDSLASLPRSA
jgi:hypothetical protein